MALATPAKRNKRGLSLLETTVALYVLISALLVIAALFHSGIKARTETNKRRQATEALRRAHTQAMELNARDLGGRYGFDQIRDDWQPSHVEPVPDYPDFEATYRVSDQPVFSPCSTFELDRYPTNQQLILGSRLRVELEVVGLGQTVRSSFWLSDPPREVHPTDPIRLRRTSGQDPLPIFDPATKGPGNIYEATLYDKYDQPIEGATFNWGIMPVTGNGSIFWDLDFNNRAGKRARLFNFVVTEFGDISYRPGLLRLECRSRYRGVEYEEIIDAVEMDAPP